MGKFNLLFESSPWLIALGVAIGLAYAIILYYRVRAPWGRKANYALAALRFLMVTQLTLLLFGPLIRRVRNSKEPPSVVFAVDNSSSVAETEDSVRLAELQNKINVLERDLENAGYVTEIRTLTGKIKEEPIAFNANESNLDNLLRGIQNDYESRNLALVLFFSDGLYNRGSNPLFRPYNFRINTIGLGDTARRPDVNLNALLFNKIAYQGNQFPLVAELFTYNLTGQKVTVQVLKNGEVLGQKTISIHSESQFDKVEFLLDATGAGIQRYTVRALAVTGEHITSNNYKDAYIDIIEGKEKILLVAPSPHPDIKALKNALESNKNYEVVLYIKGIHEYKNDKYDVIILHQVPDKRNRYPDILQMIKQQKIPAFFIYGSHSEINRLNEMNGLVRIEPISYKRDNVYPAFNPLFDKFIYSEENLEVLNDYVPVKVPFANYRILPQAAVMLYQRVGKVQTKKPLFLMQKSGDWASAVFLGEGMWMWRMQEYAKNQSHKAFDEMINKTIQFLSAREDRRKFKVYPIKKEFLNNEPVIFETEIYDDIYERIYGQKITLRIRDQDNNTSGYTYVTSERNSRYRISGLENGIYQYTASVMLKGKKEVVTGVFTVHDLQIETTNLTADHQLLENLAERNGGQFYSDSQIDKLKDDLLAMEKTYKIYSSEKYLAIINMQWGFFLLVLLVTAEWFLRKFYGSY